MILSFGDKSPKLADDVFVAPGAMVVGDVTIGPGSSVWFNSVLRADLINPVLIGAGTNLQDGAIVHIGYDCGTTVGDRVIVGHGAQIHGCVVEDQCLIGMGAILLNHARIGAGCIVAAGAVVRERMQVPPRQLVAGVPARVVRAVTEEEFQKIAKDADEYRRLAARYRTQSGDGNEAKNGGRAGE